MPTIAIAGASGKLGGATLSALLAHNLIPASSIIALTSSHPGSSTFTTLAATAPGLQVRHASFEDPASFEQALRGVDRFFLVSTPHIQLDFDREVQGDDDDGGKNKKRKKWVEVSDGDGRERHHRVAIDAAVKAGVRRIYYSSLAFAYSPQTRSGTSTSKAAVMRAHLRTEAYLARLRDGKQLDSVTVLREGLYAESWPLYLGYFAADGADPRREVLLAGDGKVSWTAIRDLGIASAVVLAAAGGSEFDNGLFYLSTRARTAMDMAEVAGLVGAARGGAEVSVRVVGRDEHERYYVEEKGLDEAAVRWWASTYEALEEGECEVDDGMLEELLGRVGVKPEGMEEVVRRMVKG